LKGYLSDYLPYKYDEEYRVFEWIDDYSKIVHINNPIEDLKINLENQFDDYFNPPVWIIKEELAPEIDASKDIQDEINKIVIKEPKINFNNWLSFNNYDFNLDSENEFLAIYQNTALTNSSKTINSFIECFAYIIDENDFSHFFKELKKDSRAISVSHYGYPDTDTYTNPSNLFWMDWIGENNNSIAYDEDKLVFNALTRVMINNVEGEEEIIIPSKKIRKLLKISELDGNSYLSSDNTEIGFKHQVNRKQFSYGDYQEIILLNKNNLQKILSKNKLKLFWLGSHFIKKNPLNDEIKSLNYSDNFRQYIIWFDEKNELKSYKYFNK
jgi:hypothetical protein